jgi:membrane fusion protein (multidrug efflux system)
MWKSDQVKSVLYKKYMLTGQTVRKGQILFKLETEMLNQDASASKAMVQAAEVEVNRLKPLVDRNIISDVMLETVKPN